MEQPDSAPSTDVLKKRVAEFAGRYLDTPSVPRRDKVIHDALWGTQLLHRHEVAYLNTPLIQRLRRLHQTGFAFLTYPSTTHTRFEHSLGVLYQTDKLAKSLLEKYHAQEELITRDTIVRLRLAALLHDCSHGPFSHTSEEIYRFFPEMQEYVKVGGEFESSSPSEVLAHFILTSEPFRVFLARVREEIPIDVTPQWLSDTILGLSLKKDPLSAHLGDIINGPFDADKLDYIFRDGHYSGLPLGIDLDRLWYATEIHLIKPEELDGVPEPMRRLVMATSGINSLEQIVGARMNLTSSLYQHHKVRACDCMLKAVFEYCISRQIPICGRRIETAADFLYLTDFDVFSEAERHTDATVREMLQNLVNRQLYKRALVISMNTFERGGTDKGTEESEKLSLVYKVAFVTKDPTGARKHRELAEKIWEAAGKPGLKEEVWLDFPSAPKLKDLSLTFINVGRQDTPEFKRLSEFVPLDQWGKQYVLNKWRGHVFCRPKYVEEVSRAAESVLSSEFRVKFTPYARTLCNLSK